jgi:hypothetical protein
MRVHSGIHRLRPSMSCVWQGACIGGLVDGGNSRRFGATDLPSRCSRCSYREAYARSLKVYFIIG